LSDEVRSPAEALAQFQEAVSDMLAQPIERAEVQSTIKPERPALADGLKAVLPVEDPGSFASLLSWSDPTQPLNQRSVVVRRTDPSACTKADASAKVRRRA
jgi:L-lysine 2,3-aminomutase